MPLPAAPQECEAQAMSAEFDIVVVGSGPAGQKAAIQSAKLGKQGGAGRAPRVGRRREREHRHDPVEDDSRGDPLPDGAQPAVDLRPGLPAEGRDLDRRHRAARAPGGRARAEHHPRPAAAESRDAARGNGDDSPTRTRSRSTAPDGTERRLTADFIVLASRLRAGAPARDRLQRVDGARQRRHRAAAARSCRARS